MWPRIRLQHRSNLVSASVRVPALRVCPIQTRRTAPFHKGLGVGLAPVLLYEIVQNRALKWMWWLDTFPKS